MSLSRQLMLGSGVFLGGGVLLYAILKMDAVPMQGEGEAASVATVTAPSTLSAQPTNPLTADMNTETRILEQKRRERELKVAELDTRTREFLAEQDAAEALAMQKARLENEQYRQNAIEPVIDEPVRDNQGTTIRATDTNRGTTSPLAPVVVTQPTITARPMIQQPLRDATAVVVETPKTAKPAASDTPTVATVTPSKQPPNRPQKYTVKRGDGLIKVARQYGIPVAALVQNNGLSMGTHLSVGQQITIPAGSDVNTLVRQFEAKQQPLQTAQTQKSRTEEPAHSTTTSTQTASAPTSAVDYKVARGDGLIKLSRKYNVPVDALAQANDLTTRSTLRVGQKLTIPSAAQVARLQREAAQRKQVEEQGRNAEQRLAEARKQAAQGEAKGTFGVQVALADNQARADEVVAKMRAAGYKATTSATSRGVRVIVGPEKGKPAALALKDKINADANAGVNGAWVLYWR